ncbi:MAG: efflux RND transporter periplasmic adaptor subunit [Proteobacteria bacterium]|nr:efflux RND transporter periplasmic adaptor subunit [Pseudomonadota bacterium]NOG59276.1 efflux RND transporter periplasmic adaptor subunit [Pseudomonadota bacterium]
MPEQMPPQVTVANPVMEEITDWDEFTGRLYAVKSVEVRPRVSGYLESVHFAEGSIVNKGDLLYIIDPRPYQAALDQAKAELERAKATQQLADNDLSRAERLFKTRVMPEEELDSRRSQKSASIASVQAAKAAVVAAQLDVEFTHIKSPITGRISRTRITEGNLVTTGDNDSNILTTIVSLDPIYVYFTADEQAVLHYTRMDMAGVRKSSRTTANPVYLRLADEEEYFHEGRMDFVDNQLDLATGTMRGRAIVQNPDFLLVPGMFADVKLLGKGPYEAVMIPDSAISLDQTNKFVYVVDESNMVSRRQIKTGNKHGNLRVVLQGLSKDDRIVINGLQRVRAGMQVSPEERKIESSSEG